MPFSLSVRSMINSIRFQRPPARPRPMRGMWTVAFRGFGLRGKGGEGGASLPSSKIGYNARSWLRVVIAAIEGIRPWRQS